ncbi:GNAT family N-acetyltransferase [Candidatus Saccharibacteria bacterium]|nr:GNAT family N-acetyltransferase [Candidatus Saccharibacteria bacterium]
MAITSQEYTIQVMRLADIPILHTTIVHSIGQAFNYFSPQFQRTIASQHSLWRLIKAYISPRARFLVLCNKAGECVGYNLVRTDRQSTAYILWMYVAPDLRGLGLGARLLQRSLEEAKRMKARRLQLVTHDKEDFYAHFGFISRQRIPGMLDDIDMVIMERELMHTPSVMRSRVEVV